jgi:hypothetical protein
MATFKVYISSTQEDLSAHRLAVREAIIRMGMLPVMEEDFGPVDLDMTSFLQQKIEESDIFIGIYAHDYGRKVGGKAVIEMEYEWACAKGVQRLLFLIDEHAPWQANLICRGENAERLDAFKQRITQETFFSTFQSPADLQAMVFFGLHEAEKHTQHNTGWMMMHPIFGIPPENPQFRSDVFMIMPFAPQFELVYREHIIPVAESLGFSIKRGDDYYSRHSIIEEIWAGIYYCRFVIVECTGRNDNVAYELGIAHTLGKTGILITQNIDDIPFDLQHLRIIAYENTPQGLEMLRMQLQKSIQWLTMNPDQ